jgi:hypothetical protein
VPVDGTADLQQQHLQTGEDGDRGDGGAPAGHAGGHMLKVKHQRDRRCRYGKHPYRPAGGTSVALQ